MTITCDTELSEILDHKTICDPVVELNNKTQQLLETRIGALESALQSGGGCGPEQIIDGTPMFFNSGKEIYDKYGTLSENVSTFATNTCQLAVSKELEELGDLSDAIVRKIEQIDLDIEDAEEAEAKALQQGSQFAMVSPQVTLAQLREERRKYVDKLERVGARIKTIDPDAEIAVAPPLADLGSAGAEDDGAGEEETTAPEETEATVPAGDQFKIPTEGKSTAEMYSEGLKIQEAVEMEENVLQSNIASVEYNIRVLEEQHNQGLVSDDVYKTALAEYERQRTVYDRALDERLNLMAPLTAATADRGGTHDGWLKDSQETAFFNGTLEQAGNEANTAARVESEINAQAANITPLDQVLAEAGGSGISPNMAAGMENNPYAQTLVGTQTSFSEYSNVSSATQMAAYDYATNTGTATEVAPGVYSYSVTDYLCSLPYDIPPSSGHYSASEYYTMTTGYYGAPDGSGDTVYDSNTGEYYAYYDWASKQAGEN